jgi:two-component system heavy metal sensor histidine kinase CusS
MFSKPTEPRAIASQLVLLFTPAAALLLACALIVFYVIVVRHAFEEDNAVLADKIVALRTSLRTAAGPQAIAEELKAVPGERTAYWVRVIDAKGNTMTETPGMEALLPRAIFPHAPKADQSPPQPRDYRARAKLFSMAVAIEPAGGRDYVLQVAQDRSGDEDFRKQFATLLVAVLALGIVASAVIAITVTKRGLRPLADMTRSFRRVGPTRLHERVPPAKWPRELQPMAVAFDEMLDRLEDSFKRLSQFSADLAHELRTPVANILGEAQVALTRPRSTDEYREVIESVAGECEKLSGIIDKLLFLARAEASDKNVQRTIFDGRAAVEKIATLYEAIAEEQQVSMTCIGQGEVYADAMLFGQAVTNLVENALRFTPPNGRIQIAIAKRPGETGISVSDSGCGIAAEHLSRIFDRFYRVDPSRSSQGVGLGLALVKSIAELHGGVATVQSEPNRGTTVTLTFPNQPAL